MIRCFPDPYPDELLYSMWARFADRVRYPTEKHLLREIFGNDRIRPIIDLPCHIALFSKRLTVDYNYTVNDFIDKHTLFNLYRPFMPQEKAAALREQMIASESRGLPRGFYRKFGIVNSLVPRMPWLRYCPMCWQEDRTNFGEAYWHRLHQVPGFEICPLHRTFIENSSVRIRGSLSGRTLVSAECILPVTSPRFADSSPLCKALICIAKDISYLLVHPEISFTPHFFRKQYLALLAKQGFLTKRGTVRNIALLNAFVDYYTLPLLHQFNCEINENRAWLIRLVTTHRYQHPLHHILTIHFLGAMVKDFFDQNQKLSPPFGEEPRLYQKLSSLFGEGPWPCLNSACEYYQQKCIITFQLKGTPGKENRPVGIFACTCGFIYSRVGPDCLPEDAFRKDRVLSYGTVWEARLKELWLDPTITRQDIARSLGISEENVGHRAIKLHLAIPRISPRNREGKPRLIRDTQWYRTQWLTLLEDAPEKGLTFLRRASPSLYQWLYSNDKDWFMAHRPPRKLWGRRRNSKKDFAFKLKLGSKAVNSV